MGKRKVCKYSLWWVVTPQPLQTGMRLLQLKESKRCSPFVLANILEERWFLVRSPSKKQSDPCTVGSSVNPTVPSPAFFRMRCDLILHHSSELSVCFDAVAKKLSPRTRCWRLVFRKVGWHHNGGDTNKHMENERGGNSTPLCPICLPLFNLHGSSLRSTSGVLSTATAIYNSDASLGQKHLTHTNAHIEESTLRFVCFLRLVLYSMPNSQNWFRAMMQRFDDAKLFFLSFF